MRGPASLPIFIVGVVVGVTLAADCDDFVASLSQYDVYLASRAEIANNLTETDGMTAQKFVDALGKINVGGEKYACGLTSFWIDGVFSGSEIQYEERRRISEEEGQPHGYGIEAGYHDIIADNQTQKLFEQYADLKDHFVVFKFQTAGVTDHVWIVLQAPGPKYKIYQSYNMAYSVHAWIADNIDGMYNRTTPGYIRYWDEVRDLLEGLLKMHGGSIAEDGTINFGTDDFFTEELKEWARYIVGYNQTLIEGNFEKAWNKFGKNEWLTKEVFMKEYVSVLQTMFPKIKDLIGTSNPWTQDLQDDWIGLFGSPNPVCYPGVPFDTSLLLVPEPHFLELQVKVKVVKLEDNSCHDNYVKIGQTIEGWKDEFDSEENSSPAIGNAFVITIVALLFSVKLV